MAGAFTRGDVVQLKSGGQKMTVTSVGSGDIVNCAWFEKNTQKAGRFHADVLALADDDHGTHCP